MNASLDEKSENLILKKYYNVGFAADTPNGLAVPVIRDADQKGVMQIAQEMSELSAQARDGKLKPGDMQGASFTIIAGRHRRDGLHADCQRAQGGNPRPVQGGDEVGVGRQHVPAAPDDAAVAVL